MPSFSDHGPHPGASKDDSTDNAVSWCQGTNQFALPDFSNKVARYGMASPSADSATASNRRSEANSATSGFLIRWRAPARLRLASESAAMRASHSRCEMTFSWIQYPSSDDGICLITYLPSRFLVKEVTVTSFTFAHHTHLPPPTSYHRVTIQSCSPSCS